MALRGEHVEASDFGHTWREAYIGAAPRHISGDGDPTLLARLHDDLCLLLILTGVEHLVR